MIQSPYKILKKALKSLPQTDIFKLAIYTALAALSTTWSVIALEKAGFGTSQALFIHGIDNILGAILLIFISIFWKLKKLIRGVWKVLIWLSCFSWLCIFLVGFDLQNTGVLFCLIAAVICTHLIAVCLFADTLEQAQSGEDASIKLAVMLMAVPICKIIFVALGGLLADIGLNFVAGFMFLSLLISNAFWHKHQLLHTLRLHNTHKIWHIFDNSKRVMLITLSALFNALNVPVRFVFMPLYFFEESGGSATKLGGFLALFGLVGLIAQILKKRAIGKTINTYSIMLYGVLLYALVPLFWFMFYDFPWVVAALMMFGQVVSVLWSYGYFAELRKISEATPTLVNQQWQITNGIFVGMICLFLTVLSDDLMLHMKTYLIVQFAILILFMSYFIFWWHKKSIKNEG